MVSRISRKKKNAPWWQQQKIRFMWGQWHRTWNTGCTPDALMARLANIGTTVYAEAAVRKNSTEMIGHGSDTGVYFDLEVARAARRHGIRYFGAAWLSNLPDFAAEHPHRLSRRADGKPYFGTWGRVITRPCPLDKQLYEKWFLAPCLEAAETGLVDGLHLDWEAYSGRGEAGVCYCDDCFQTFLNAPQAALPLEKRHDVLVERELVKAYEQFFEERRAAMFREFAQRVRAIQPDFVFSGYNILDTVITRNLQSDSVPFMILDARHYFNDDRQPWWESYGAALRKRGFMYIPGGWTNALFGSQPSQVSAARWIYEASINEDGCWLWFERELDDEILRAYATADREIRAVVRKLGKFLFQGKRDPNFATAVEWTGRPKLECAVIHQTYHVGDEHLAHINNVNTEWPLRVRVRFPRLPKGDRWLVRDPMNDLYYSRDGKSAEWTVDDLLGGLIVALDPRRDLYLLLAPMREVVEPDVSALLRSLEFSTLPSHAAASDRASPIKATVHLYFMKNAVFDGALESLLSTTEKAFDLPKDGWRFKMDKEDVGAVASWFLPTTPQEDWTPIEIEGFWGNKGSTGPGWYRRDVDIPVLPEGKRVYLHFGAVDEELVLWIDGEYAGDYNRGPGGWEKPFAIDVTGKLTAGKHHIALRVYNSGYAGGIWKPVSVLAGQDTAASALAARQEKSAATGALGRLLCSVTEPMDFEVGSGTATLGNVIRTINTVDESQLRLRQVKARLWSPRYSPDGKRVVFVQDVGGRGQICVMNEDGTNAVNISDNTFCDRFPVWSPDGLRIAFVSARKGDWGIYTMNADGSAQRHLVGNPGVDRAPAWSPDGAHIAWESHVSGTPHIWICDANGQDSHPVIESNKPFVIQRAGEEGIVQANPILPGNEFYLTAPVWSPDGRFIAGVGLSGSHMVVVLDAKGSSMLQLIPWLPGAADVCWSPDGTRLAGTWRTGPQETERSGIFVAKTDGSDDTYGKWLVDVTPTGPRLGRAQRHPFVTWYSHGSSQPRRVLKTFTSVAWSPDNRTLAFSSDMDPGGAFYVYIISPDGGEPRRLDGTKSAWPQGIMWRP